MPPSVVYRADKPYGKSREGNHPGDDQNSLYGFHCRHRASKMKSKINFSRYASISNPSPSEFCRREFPMSGSRLGRQPRRSTASGFPACRVPWLATGSERPDRLAVAQMSASDLRNRLHCRHPYRRTLKSVRIPDSTDSRGQRRIECSDRHWIPLRLMLPSLAPQHQGASGMTIDEAEPNSIDAVHPCAAGF